MIAFLEGTVAFKAENRLYLNVNGVGFEVFMPMRSLDKVGSTGSSVFVHTYMAVREDSMQLYGFYGKDELEIFKLLITVNGIGPKGGLSVLSTLSPDDLRFAVFSDDVKTISKVPGIGKKTAQKLILELKDKLKLEDVLDNEEVAVVGKAPEDDSARREAIEALTALGYSSSEAFKAVNKVATDPHMTVEDILKKSLSAIGV